ncbi:MAG: YwiC-like family protein [Opitutaceae bacterium]
MTSPSETPYFRGMIRLVLPKEHGSWSLALEPLTLGLLASPSTAGAALAVAVLAGFFLRRPVKLLLGGSADPRRPQALSALILLGTTAAASLALAAVLSSLGQLWPLLPAVPAGAAFMWFDARGESREAAAELTGALALAMIPAAFATLAGWPPAPALALAAIMAGRSVPAVMTIRTYLRRQKGQAVSAGLALAASAAAVAGAMLLARADLAPRASTVVMAALLIRTGVLLGPVRPQLPASKVGVAESVLGGILVIVLALGWIR